MGLAGTISFFLTSAAPTHAESLNETLAYVYGTNPTITGARASVRELDEGIPIARAPGLPSLSSNFSYDYFPEQSENRLVTSNSSGSASLTMDVPLFLGGSVRNSVRAAEARIRAGRSDLRSTEANLFTETVAAYLDVVSAQSVFDLNVSNVKALETNLQGAQLRYNAGELTRTDVAQSTARLEQARGELATATSGLAESKQEFVRVVGRYPENLEPPSPLPSFPATADDAADMALANNPALAAAKQARTAAGYDVNVAAAARYPRVSAYATGDYSNYFGTIPLGGLPNRNDESAAVGVRMNIPLFQGGLPGARVREAQARESQFIERTTLVERAILAEARSAHFRYQASLVRIQASEAAVSSNELALEGVRAENTLGLRTLLDVLNAELELLNSQVSLVTARRDSYVAGFALLAAVGKAEAADLGLSVTPYDPLVNYRRVKGSINDWAKDPRPDLVATRTIDVRETGMADARD